MKWKEIQTNANLYLASGVKNLKGSPKLSFPEVLESGQGNYLISSGSFVYVGEAKVLSKRLKQHSSARSSTFYKNYLKLEESRSKKQISDFHVQLLPNGIGRKEIEEFSIVNLPANLNRFQLGKRPTMALNAGVGLWRDIQVNSEELLLDGYKSVKRKKGGSWKDSKVLAVPGVYLVAHKTKGLVYVGESSNLLERWKTHSSSTYFSALRRSVATQLLGYKLKSKNGKKKYLTAKEDVAVSKYLSVCSFISVPVQFGRYELEELLIRRETPLLNIKT